MSGQKHIIKRQLMELKVQDPAEAQPLLAELSRIYRQRLVPLIERCCDELSAPDQLHRIERLELDLGPVDPDRLEADLVAKVGAALRQRLAEVIGCQESAAVPPDKTPKAQSQLELFTLFARHGSLPWWADLAQPHLLEDSLDYLLRHAPDRLRRLLSELAREDRPLQRLIRHYDDRRLAALAVLHTAELGDIPEALFQSLMVARERARLLAGAPSSEFRRQLWQIILHVAALSDAPHRDPSSFCQSVLKRLAAKYGMRYAALLQDLCKAPPKGDSDADRKIREMMETLVDDAAPYSSREGWRALSSRRSRRSLDEAEPAERNPGSPGPDQYRRSLDEEAELAKRNPGSLDQDQNRRSSSLGTGRAQQPIPPDPTRPPFRRLFSSLLSQLLEARRAPFLARFQPLFDTAPAGVLLAELDRWLGENQADLPPDAVDRWQTAVQSLTAPSPEAPAKPEPLPAAPVAAPTAVQRRTDAASIDLSFSDADEVTIDTAGLVLLWPFLGHFFERLGLVTENRFQDDAAVQRAVGLLHYLATEETDPPEYRLPLAKVLCGLEPDALFLLEPPLSAEERDECGLLLSAVIEHAPILRNMSIAGFRSTFLRRQGILSQRDGAWLLRVERETYDIVLERFPWSVDWVKLPWMTAPLRVEW